MHLSSLIKSALKHTILALFTVIFIGACRPEVHGQVFKTPQELQINCTLTNKVQEKVFFEYGAVFISTGFKPKSQKLPPCIFTNQLEVSTYQSDIGLKCFTNFGGGKFCLQSDAKTSLEKVFEELGGYEFIARNCTESNKKKCTNGINDDWSLRSYEHTVCNWFDDCNALASKNSLSQDDWKTVESEVVNSSGKPKMFSYAVPGGSQHHWGLAIDVNDRRAPGDRICGDACSQSLQKNGWFRTIRYDRFHFTFLGRNEDQLRREGLKKVRCKDTFFYWVPNAPLSYSGYTDPNWKCVDAP